MKLIPSYLFSLTSGSLISDFWKPFTKYPSSKYETIDEVKEWMYQDGKAQEVNLLDLSSAWELYRHKKDGVRNVKGDYLYLEPKPEYGHEYTFIFIHGMLQSSQWSLQHFIEYNKNYLVPKHTKVILPSSPEDTTLLQDDYFGLAQGSSWFSMRTISEDDKTISLKDSYRFIEQSMLDYQSDQILDIIEKETALLNGKTENVFIGGFSQGCMLSLSTFLKMKKEALGGVLCFSGIQGLDTREMEIDHELKRKTELYFNHGSLDTVIKPDNSQITYSFFEKHDYDFEYVEDSDKAHDFGSEKDFMAIRSFLANHMHGGPLVEEWKNEVIKKEMQYFQKSKENEGQDGWFS